jgi:hypothetical protein
MGGSTYRNTKGETGKVGNYKWVNMQEYRLQINAVPLYYRRVNMQEWWVNINKNGGSTCAGIYK